MMLFHTDKYERVQSLLQYRRPHGVRLKQRIIARNDTPRRSSLMKLYSSLFQRPSPNIGIYWANELWRMPRLSRRWQKGSRHFSGGNGNPHQHRLRGRQREGAISRPLLRERATPLPHRQRRGVATYRRATRITLLSDKITEC